MVGAPVKGNYKLILDQDGAVDPKGEKQTVYKAEKGECDGKDFHISYPLAPYGCAMFEFNG